jgi:hypothetical protein
LEQIRNLNRGDGARAHGGLLETSAVHSEGEYELILKRAAKMKGKPSQAVQLRHKKKKKAKAKAKAAAAAAAAAGASAADAHPDEEHADVGKAVFKTAIHHKTPEDMSVEELVNWLGEHRLGVYTTFFEEHGIDGETLAVLESTDVDSWGVGSSLERRKLLTLLHIKVSAAPVAPAAAAPVVDFKETAEYAAFLAERESMQAQLRGMQGALTDAERAAEGYASKLSDAERAAQGYASAAEQAKEEARAAHDAEVAAREALDAQSKVQEQMQKSLSEAKAAPTGVSGALETLGGSLDESVHALWDYKRTLHERAWELGGNIRVLCRVRPILPHEKQGTGSALDAGKKLSAQAKRNAATLQSKAINACRFGERGHKIFVRKHEGNCRMSDGEYPFTFNKVFPPAEGQAETYERIRPVALSVLTGVNACILAYGSTGSGKTFTMDGPETGRNESNAGVYSRTIGNLLQLGAEHYGEKEYVFMLRMVELYKTDVVDLLSPGGGQVLTIVNHEINAAAVGFTTLEEFDAAADIARSNRTVAAHTHNPVSSRSHLIIHIEVRAVPIGGSFSNPDEVEISSLQMVDLAGSEGASAYAGLQGQALVDRQEEGKHIRESLLALGNVMRKLASADKKVSAVLFGRTPSARHSSLISLRSLLASRSTNPAQSRMTFRGNMLVNLLAPSLTRGSKVLFICNISPTLHDATSSASLGSLRFVEECGQIKLGTVAQQKRNAAELARVKKKLSLIDIAIERLEMVASRKPTEASRPAIKKQWLTKTKTVLRKFLPKFEAASLTDLHVERQRKLLHTVSLAIQS